MLPSRVIYYVGASSSTGVGHTGVGRVRPLSESQHCVYVVQCASFLSLCICIVHTWYQVCVFGKQTRFIHWYTVVWGAKHE